MLHMKNTQTHTHKKSLLTWKRGLEAIKGIFVISLIALPEPFIVGGLCFVWYFPIFLFHFPSCLCLGKLVCMVHNSKARTLCAPPPLLWEIKNNRHPP